MLVIRYLKLVINKEKLYDVYGVNNCLLIFFRSMHLSQVRNIRKENL